MKIVIDYDGTFTADPELWSIFIENAEARGHKVYIATGRAGTVENVEVVRAFCYLHKIDVPVFFCGSRPKKEVLTEAGLTIDIWCDDNPCMIDLGYKGLDMFGENQGGSRD